MTATTGWYVFGALIGENIPLCLVILTRCIYAICRDVLAKFACNPVNRFIIQTKRNLLHYSASPRAIAIMFKCFANIIRLQNIQSRHIAVGATALFAVTCAARCRARFPPRQRHLVFGSHITYCFKICHHRPDFVIAISCGPIGHTAHLDAFPHDPEHMLRLPSAYRFDHVGWAGVQRLGSRTLQLTRNRMAKTACAFKMQCAQGDPVWVGEIIGDFRCRR